MTMDFVPVATHAFAQVTWYRHLRLHGSSVMSEIHEPHCTCSYHKRLQGRFGLKLPEVKARNSWRILFVRLRGRLYVLRWTLPRTLFA